MGAMENSKTKWTRTRQRQRHTVQRVSGVSNTIAALCVEFLLCFIKSSVAAHSHIECACFVNGKR